MKVMVIGCSWIDDPGIICEALFCSGFKAELLVTRTSRRGVDPAVKQMAKDFNIKHRRVTPDWYNLGKIAGDLTDAQILKCVDAVLALWDGVDPAVEKVLKTAQKLGLKVFVHQIEARNTNALYRSRGRSLQAGQP